MTDLISRVTEIADDLDTLVDDEMIATLREAANALEAAREDAMKWRKYAHLIAKMSDVAETMAPVIQFRIELQEAAKKAKEVINE